MSELVERLRAHTCGCGDSNVKHDTWHAADRIEALEAALREVERRTALLLHQNTGLWKPGRVGHDKRTVDVLSTNQRIIDAAFNQSQPTPQKAGSLSTE